MDLAGTEVEVLLAIQLPNNKDLVAAQERINHLWRQSFRPPHVDRFIQAARNAGISDQQIAKLSPDKCPFTVALKPGENRIGAEAVGISIVLLAMWRYLGTKPDDGQGDDDILTEQLKMLWDNWFSELYETELS